MQNNQVLDELENYLEQQKLNNQLRIEVRLGTIIPKNKEAIQDLQYFQDACVNVESKIEKKNYRFEAAIGREDFEKASHLIKSDDRWEFTLDIIFPISYMVNLSYRIGLDEEGKVFCYERKKELKAKHLDVMDQSRQYRVSLSQFENADYYSTNVCVEKIKDLLKKQQEIGCIRFKQTRIYYQDDESEQFVFQVQQAEKNKQNFLVEVAQNIVNENNSFKKNVDNALNLFKEQGIVYDILAYYYKPFYEAEISLKQNKIAQSSAVLAEKYLEKIRKFHDSVRLMNPKITLSGLKDQQKQSEPNFQKGTRGNQTRTRGNNRQDLVNILQDVTEDSFDQQPYRGNRDRGGRGGRGGRGRGQDYHKDHDDDERYQSRTEDYL